MNTNETQEIEIPAEWDVTVQAAERRGYRAGVEALKEELFQQDHIEHETKGEYIYCVSLTQIDDVADQLLAEQEET